MIGCDSLAVDNDNETYKEWFAVYTVVRHEKIVNSALSEECIETFLPLREEVSQWKDRKKRVQFPLFPGYLFVNVDLRNRMTFYSVLNTRGVVRILGINRVPIPVPYEQISAIKRLLENNFKYDPYPYFNEGKEALIINGPFEGVKGKIVERRGVWKLILSVDLIQRSVAVEVDIRDVELV